MLSAWGDESGSHSTLDPGAYLLGAAVTFDADVDEVRTAFERLRRPSEMKMHWRSDSRARHRQVVDTITELKVEAIVVVRRAHDDHPERQRRKCSEPLARELTEMGVAHLTMESRGPADDRRDMKMLEHLRRSRALSGGLRLHHQPGPKEPLLWIADAVCGAVTAHRIGDTEYLKMIEKRTTVQVIDTTAP